MLRDDDIDAVRRRIAVLEQEVRRQLDELGVRGLYAAAANVLQAAEARSGRDPEATKRLKRLAKRAELEADRRIRP